MADRGGEGVRSACDGLAGVGEEGLVPFPEGGEGLGSAMEGGPWGIGLSPDRKKGLIKAEVMA